MSIELASQFIAETEQRCREKVVYPAAERRAAIDRELRAMQPHPARVRHRRVIIAWLGDRLIRLGERLGGGAALPGDAGPFGPGGMTAATGA